MNKEEINNVAKLISKVDGNLVLSEKYKPCLRIGVQPLDISQDIIDRLLSSTNGVDVFIQHSDNYEKIKDSLYNILILGTPLIGELRKNGIYASTEFQKAIFVASYGAKQGEKINYFVPAYGLEEISSYINHNSFDTSSIVINPNLCGLERFYKILGGEKWDVVGFSTVPIAFSNDGKMIAQSHLLSPNSLKVLGGYNIEDFDHEALFRSFHLDMIIVGPGATTMLDIVQNMNNLNEVVSRNTNILIHEKTQRKIIMPPSTMKRDYSLEIPLQHNDVYHETNYKSANISLSKSKEVPEEQLKNGVYFLKISDQCNGTCPWCAAPKRKSIPLSIDDALDALDIYTEKPEGIHFLDNDLTFSKERVIKLCQELIRRGYSDIPKLGKGRPDNITYEMLTWLAKAGFQKFGYGIESFSQEVLDGLQKGSTVEDNHRAIQDTFAVGIIPIMNLIFFSPWETEDTLINSIDTLVPYVERGAIINSAVGMNATFGSRIIHTRKDLIIYEELEYDGMKEKFYNPIRLRCLDSHMQELLEQTLQLREEFKQSPQMEHLITYSSHLNSLCAIKTVYELLGKDAERIQKLIGQNAK